MKKVELRVRPYRPAKPGRSLLAVVRNDDGLLIGVFEQISMENYREERDINEMFHEIERFRDADKALWIHWEDRETEKEYLTRFERKPR